MSSRPSLSGSPARSVARASVLLNLDSDSDGDGDSGESGGPTAAPASRQQDLEADPSLLLESGSGIPIKIVSKYGAALYSNLVASGAGIFWRLRPERLGCDLSYLREVTHSFTCHNRLVLSFGLPPGHSATARMTHAQAEAAGFAFDLQVEFDDRVDELSGKRWLGSALAEAVLRRLEGLVARAGAGGGGAGGGGGGAGGAGGASPPASPGSDDCPSPSAAATATTTITTTAPALTSTATTASPKQAGSSLLAYLDDEDFRCSTRAELCHQLSSVLRWKEGALLLDRIAQQQTRRAAAAAFAQWTRHIQQLNGGKMEEDCQRWRLHASVNLDTDLQAWYHAVFCKEVYRLRGPFWFRDAVLPQYRHSLDLVDQALTPLEEAALAHVLCSPETTYGDVAGQMMVVQSLVSPELYSLFQDLAAKGAQIIKCPRSGRPAKKMFRFSFVEGSIYLTWRGKFGNQGVDLGEVASVSAGVTTDITRRHAHAGKEDCYLSLNADTRSVDLCFEDGETRDDWLELLRVLVDKEKGQLGAGVELVTDLPPSASDAEWLVLYAALGEAALPLEKKQRLLSRLGPGRR